eukprot:GHVU01213661.1.p1 GENE.GHVU01213661.1~~GHVU01213661.1.p1  ORF type:complete len:209 (+),score=11.30 GHVU01213661.1:752-1378(+)
MTMPQTRPAPALTNPATGSANPAASLLSLWNYVAPAAAHLMQAPTNTPGKAPALDVGYHMGIHTAVYHYFTVPRPCGAPAGPDFYELLDGWFGEVARDALLGLPEGDSERLVQYLVPCFQRYQSGAGAVSRLLNYTNRQYVKRAIDVSPLVILPCTLLGAEAGLSVCRETVGGFASRMSLTTSRRLYVTRSHTRSLLGVCVHDEMANS